MFDEILNPTNALWDDGEWVSWANINRLLDGEDEGDEEEGWELVEEGDGLIPEGSPEEESSMQKLERLEIQVERACEALARGEDIGWRIGEMGELYAEATFRIRRHRKHAQGSDGKLGNDFVEVKTISPWKKTPEVRVKRSGHWSRLVVVRIREQWMFDAKMFQRKELGHGNGGKHVKVRWEGRSGREDCEKCRF